MSDAVRRPPHVWRLEELVNADSIPALESMPHWPKDAVYVPGEPDLDRLNFRQVDSKHWVLEGVQGLGGPIPGMELMLHEADELRGAFDQARREMGHRPLWLDQHFLPQLVSTPKRRPAGEAHALSFHIEWPEISVNAYPYCTVGKVETSRGKQGSGVLVGGRIMLTCSHVVPWGDDGWWMKFTPAAFDDDAKFGASFVSDAHGYRTNPAETNAWDFAVCRLYEPLGERCGYLGYYGTTDDGFYENNDRWMTIGYPGTSRPQMEMLVDVQDVDDDGDASEIETTWDSAPGWSGGPLWGWIDNDPKVIGVASGNEIDDLGGWISDSDHGVFAGGLAMANLVSWARQQWP